MENSVCQMNCRTCTRQEGDENKMMCSSLLTPSMIGLLIDRIDQMQKSSMTGLLITRIHELNAQMQELKKLVSPKKINEIKKINEVKLLTNQEKNEHDQSNGFIALGGDES